MINGLIAHHFKILRRLAFRRFGLVERVGETYPVHSLLRSAIDRSGRGEADLFQYGRHDVCDVSELRSRSAALNMPRP